jgi:hypothetical protein
MHLHGCLQPQSGAPVVDLLRFRHHPVPLHIMQIIPTKASNQVTVTCDGGPGSMFQGFVKGLYYGSGPRGQFVGEDSRYPGGMHGTPHGLTCLWM